MGCGDDDDDDDAAVAQTEEPAEQQEQPAAQQQAQQTVEEEAAEQQAEQQAEQAEPAEEEEEQAVAERQLDLNASVVSAWGALPGNLDQGNAGARGGQAATNGYHFASVFPLTPDGAATL